jgi:hypothetical protein
VIDPSFWYSSTGTALLALCWLISLYLVLRLWRVRHADPKGRKIVWSIVLLLFPVFGWILYAGFYKAPKPVGNGHHQYSGLG